jgi:hypothetical protein
MGYIKEPKDVDFAFEPLVVTAEDGTIISEAIAHYKVTGKFKKVPKPKKNPRVAKKKVKR